MFCTTIIPTIGRPSLGRAVESVLKQSLPDDSFEVIVVNDSGEALREEAWQHSRQVQIIHTNQHNRCVARNAGAALARGEYLHFLDDDDWMLPGVFQHFWRLAERISAAWLYGAFRLVDSTGKTVGEVFPDETGNCLMPLLGWEWLPIQASMINSKAFFTVGGFDPLPPFERIFQDVDLSRRIALYYDMAQISKIACCIRTGEANSTTNYADMFIANRQSREKIFKTSGAFKRMVESTDSDSSYSSYWRGKIIHYYLASAKWNIKHRHLLTAFSRTAYAAAGFFNSDRHILTKDFWRGLLKPHYPRVGRLLADYDEDLFANTWRTLVG